MRTPEDPLRFVFLLPLVALLACFATTVGDGKDSGAQDTSGDTGEEDFASPFAGAWSGTVDGHAEFEADWETSPYCSGEVTATVEATGAIAGAGDCVILFGPYTDFVFDVTLTGQILATGEAELEVVIEEDSDEHVWDDAALAGSADEVAGTLNVEGATMYHPTGLEPIAGFEVVALSIQ